MNSKRPEKQAEKPKDGSPRSKGKDHERLSDLQADVFAEINEGSRVPLSRTEADLVTKTSEKPVTAGAVLADFATLNWSAGLKKLFALIFGTKHATRGIGLLVKNADRIPLRYRTGLIAQIERKDQNASSGEERTRDRLISSVLRTELQLSLLRQGYTEWRRALPSGEPMAIDAEDMDVRTCVLRRNGEERGNRILKDIRPENDSAPDVLGPLTYDKPLPHGAFLHFDADGYPLFCTPDNNPGRYESGIQLYRRDAAKEREMKKKSKREQQMEFLRSYVQPGDILLVSQGGAEESVVHEYFEIKQRALTNSSFHATHVMLVNEHRELFHITSDGKNKGDVDSLIKEYNGVTIARIRGGKERQTAFARNAFARYQEVKKFNMRGLIQRGKALEQKVAMPSTSTPDACICIDLMKDGAKASNIPSLAACETPADVAKCSDIELVYSLDFEKEKA